MSIQHAAGPAAGRAGAVRAQQHPGPLGRRHGPARRPRPARPRDRVRAELLCLDPVAPARPARFLLRSGLPARGLWAQEQPLRFFLCLNDSPLRVLRSCHRRGDRAGKRSRQMAGVAVTGVVFDLAQVGGSVAVSHSPQGTGFRAAASVERRASGLSFGLLADYTSAAYSAIGLPRRQAAAALYASRLSPTCRCRGAASASTSSTARSGARPTRRSPARSRPGGSAGRCRCRSMRATRSSARAGPASARISRLALGGRRSASASVDGGRGGTAGYLSYQHDPPPGPAAAFAPPPGIGESSGAEATYVRNFSLASVERAGELRPRRAGVRLSADRRGRADGRARLRLAEPGRELRLGPARRLSRRPRLCRQPAGRRHRRERLHHRARPASVRSQHDPHRAGGPAARHHAGERGGRRAAVRAHGHGDPLRPAPRARRR